MVTVKAYQKLKVILGLKGSIGKPYLTDNYRPHGGHAMATILTLSI